VDRCPRRILDGSVCQNDDVDVGVGRVAWPDLNVPRVIMKILFLTVVQSLSRPKSFPYKALCVAIPVDVER
jgi:hypothetical protein